MIPPRAVTLVDYGLGNIAAFRNVFHRLNRPVRVAARVDDLEGADRLILPGVGHFDHAMERLERSGLRQALDHLVLEEETPVLGVCVGMQMMGQTSEEGEREGLGWIPGRTARLSDIGGAPLPHMGWNDVRPCSDAPVLLRQASGALRFYFLHSFAFIPGQEASPLASTTYGRDFCSAVRYRNRFGVQFHPEKSHEAGVRLLDAFAGESLA